MRLALICALLVGCGTEVQEEAVTRAAEVPAGYEPVEIGICRKLNAEPQLLPGRGRFNVYECAEGRIIFDPIKEEQI